jgi:hypothetical protein
MKPYGNLENNVVELGKLNLILAPLIDRYNNVHEDALAGTCGLIAVKLGIFDNPPAENTPLYLAVVSIAQIILGQMIRDEMEAQEPGSTRDNEENDPVRRKY